MAFDLKGHLFANSLIIAYLNERLCICVYVYIHVYLCVYV